MEKEAVFELQMNDMERQVRNARRFI